LSTICGITSPARWSTTRSPGRTPSRSISSALWSVALVTTTPPTVTGVEPRDRRQLAGAADLDVDRLRSVVCACCGGNLCAIAQRGARPT
jgi:hypothetical protein